MKIEMNEVCVIHFLVILTVKNKKPMQGFVLPIYELKNAYIRSVDGT